MKRLTRIANKYETDKGTVDGDKHGYTEFYQEFLEKYEHPRILELGVYHGGGTHMFNDFYDGDCDIWTIDWSTEAMEYINDIENAKFIELDLNDVEGIKQVCERLNSDGVKFDIIIDDASHIWQHQMNAMYYFGKLLADGGIYIVEDIHYSRLFWDMDQSPLFFLTFMKPVCTLSEEQNNELLDRIDEVYIFSRKNVATEDMVKAYGGRSMTAILTFDR